MLEQLHRDDLTITAHGLVRFAEVGDVRSAIRCACSNLALHRLDFRE